MRKIITILSSWKNSPILWALLTIMALYKYHSDEVKASHVEKTRLEEEIKKKDNEFHTQMLIIQSQLNEVQKINNIEAVVNKTALIIDNKYPTSDKPDSSILKTEIINQGNTLNVSFPFESKIFFRETSYSDSGMVERDNFIRKILIFTATINDICKGAVRPSVVVFEGSSDTAGKSQSTMGDKKVGIYEGEFGEINEGNIIINGARKSIRLKTNDTLTNEELALMRAYSVYKTFDEELKKRDIYLDKNLVKFIAKETAGYDDKNRYGKVTFKIENPKKECISSK